MEDCLFCKIASHQVNADVVFENDEVLAFNDIHPKAPVHILIIPKKHIASVAQLPENDGVLCQHLIMTAKKLAEERGIASEGYRLQINVGRAGGQTVDHLHLHLLGGCKMSEHCVDNK